MRHRWIPIALLLLAAPAQASADFQLWSELGVRYKIAKRLRLQFDQHLRFDEDVSATKAIRPEIGVSWRVLKFLRLEAGYRYTAEPIESSREATYIDSWHGFFASAQLRWRLKPVTLRYRLRFQEEFGWPWTDDGDMALHHAIRNKVGLEVKAGLGFVPFVSGELFVRLDDPDGLLHKWRATAGVDYAFSGHTISLFYRAEDLLDNPDEPFRHILGLGYHFGF